MALWGLARRKYGERSRHHRDRNDCPRLLLATTSRSASRPSILRPCSLRLPMPPLVPLFSVHTHVRQTHQSCFAWTQKRHTEIPTDVASSSASLFARTNVLVHVRTPLSIHYHVLPVVLSSRPPRSPSILLTSSAQLFFRLPTLSSGFACSVESFVPPNPCDPLR